MARRVPWLRLGVGAVAGGVLRVALLAVHLTGGLGEAKQVFVYGAFVGVVVGLLAAVPARPLPCAAVGAGVSLLFFLIAYPFVAFYSFLSAGTAPAWWELVVTGAVPGLLAGLAQRYAARGEDGAARPE